MTPHRVRFAIALAALSGWFAPAALGAEAVQVAGGAYHTCALTDVGGVKCWGTNFRWILGDGTNAPRRSYPVDVVGLTSGVTEIAAGEMHTCAVTSSGGVKCWGSNVWGQLGDGTRTHRATPTDVVGLTSGVAHVYASSTHTCALETSGEVWCWGFNDFGQLGDGTDFSRLSPVEVTGASPDVVSLELGAGHTCAVRAVSSAECWGSNFSGILGDGTTVDHLVPTPSTAFGTDVARVALGEEHTCLLRTGGAVQCLGANFWGHVGVGGHGAHATLVTPIGLGNGVEQLATGFWHSCVIMSAGGVRCWGTNNNGELGAIRADDHKGATWHRHVPTAVPGLPSGIAAVNLGHFHTCALTDSGDVLCWGFNANGTLGDRSLLTRARPAYVFGFGANATTTTIVSNHDPARTGQLIRFTARVSPATDLGRVRFTHQGRTLNGCGSVDVENGVARCFRRFNTPGPRRIRAHYLGSTRLTPSASAVLVQNIRTSR